MRHDLESLSMIWDKVHCSVLPLKGAAELEAIPEDEHTKFFHLRSAVKFVSKDEPHLSGQAEAAGR